MGADWMRPVRLAAILRPANAGSNTAADHFTVLGLALEQLPAEDLLREILVRTDVGGQTHAFTQLGPGTEATS